MPTLEEQIAALLATPGNPNTVTTPGTPDYAAYVAANPDLSAEFAKLTGKTLDSIGVKDKAGYGQWQYDRYGQTENRALPTTGGTSTTTYDNEDEIALGRAAQTARQNAMMAVQSRGLDYGQYGGKIDDYYANVLGTAPKGLTDYGSYFSPNAADNILSGEEQAQRRQFQNSINSLFSGGPDIGLFGTAIDDIVNPQYDAGLQYLDRGMKRGQFNQVGYNAGKSALEAAKVTALSKVRGGAESLLGDFNTSYSGIKGGALDAASGYKLGDSTDLSPYQSSLDSFFKSANASAPGMLQGMFAGQKLIDLGALGQSVGSGQGAVNLHDLDIIDALDKRKRVNSVGHGLGSQGAF